MLVKFILSALGVSTLQAAAASNPYPLRVHNITRQPEGFRFENLAVRHNGQILVTTAAPEAFIYQVDPLSILPPTLVYEVPLVNGSAAGINEGKDDLFYVVAGIYDIMNVSDTHPKSYQIFELDMRGVHTLPNGTLNKEPPARRVANLTGASLPNGAAFARPGSDHLLVADSFRGLIWNVNVATGDVTVTLNDTTTKGGAAGGPTFTGINGIKQHKGSLYWTVTGTQTLYKAPIDSCGYIPSGITPTLVASNISCDDLVIDHLGNAFVASPEGVITKVTPAGEKTVIAGTYASTNSSLVGPTAMRFGRLASDRWSLYVTTNGGLPQIIGENVPSAAGVSRIDLPYPG